MVHGLSCSMAHGIFPDQGSNACLLHWQEDSLPLSHQGNPQIFFKSICGYVHICMCLRDAEKMRENKYSNMYIGA